MDTVNKAVTMASSLLVHLLVFKSRVSLTYLDANGSATRIKLGRDQVFSGPPLPTHSC